MNFFEDLVGFQRNFEAVEMTEETIFQGIDSLKTVFQCRQVPRFLVTLSAIEETVQVKNFSG